MLQKGRTRYRNKTFIKLVCGGYAFQLGASVSLAGFLFSLISLIEKVKPTQEALRQFTQLPHHASEITLAINFPLIGGSIVCG